MAVVFTTARPCSQVCKWMCQCGQVCKGEDVPADMVLLKVEPEEAKGVCMIEVNAMH